MVGLSRRTATRPLLAYTPLGTLCLSYTLTYFGEEAFEKAEAHFGDYPPLFFGKFNNVTIVT